MRKEKPIVLPPPRLKDEEPPIPNLDHVKPDAPSSPKRVTTIDEANEFDYVTRESGTLFHVSRYYVFIIFSIHKLFKFIL